MNAIPEGQYVKHYRYGLGVVTESDERQTSIDFDVHGLKRFVTTLMVVEISNLTPPPRVRAKYGAKVYARLASKIAGSKSAAKEAKKMSSGGNIK